MVKRPSSTARPSIRECVCRRRVSLPGWLLISFQQRRGRKKEKADKFSVSGRIVSDARVNLHHTHTTFRECVSVCVFVDTERKTHRKKRRPREKNSSAVLPFPVGFRARSVGSGNGKRHITFDIGHPPVVRLTTHCNIKNTPHRIVSHFYRPIAPFKNQQVSPSSFVIHFLEVVSSTICRLSLN